MYQELVYRNDVLKTILTGSNYPSLPPSHPAVFTQLLSMRSLRTILEPGTRYLDSRFQVLRIPIVDGIPYRVFSHGVTAAILVFQNNKSAAMLVSQTNPVGVELFSYAHALFCFNKLS